MLCPPGLLAGCPGLSASCWPPQLDQPSLPHCWLECHPGMPVTLGKKHWKSPGSLSQGALMVSEKMPKFTWELLSVLTPATALGFCAPHSFSKNPAPGPA